MSELSRNNQDNGDDSSDRGDILLTWTGKYFDKQVESRITRRDTHANMDRKGREEHSRSGGK